MEKYSLFVHLEYTHRAGRDELPSWVLHGYQ